jgi:folate-binding protein YgfZ
MACEPESDAMSDGFPEKVLEQAGAVWQEVEGVRVPRHFGDMQREYAAALSGAGLYLASLRGVFELRGNDRATWLNNLVTNVITTLSPGEGNYAFVPNVKGRIVADVNMLVLADAIWLDIDRRMIEAAVKHFDHYRIMEDVQWEDRSEAFLRLALLGPGAKEIAEALGATHAPAMASLGNTSVPLCQKQRLLVRHDFAGVFGVELYIHREDAEACWARLLEIGRGVNLTPVGYEAVEALRIEAGIPASVQDIDETVLPAETQQIERGISFQKGCYLGQEVIERMRAYGGLARKLVGVRFPAGAGVSPGAHLQVNGADAGRITSVCHSPAMKSTLALGYLKTAHANPGTEVRLADAPDVIGEVIPLPVRKPE